jgi:hypothetical protein
MEKDTSGKMGKKQLVSSASQHTCTSVISDKKYLAKHNVKALQYSPYSPNLSLPDFFLFPRLKNVLKDNNL